MDALATVPTVEGETGSLNLGMAVGMFLYELRRTPGSESSAPVDQRRRLGVALADGLTRAGVLRPGDHRHGRARLYAVLERLEAPERELKFLWSLLREWEGTKGGRAGR